MKSHFTEIYDVTEIVNYNFLQWKFILFPHSNYAGCLWESNLHVTVSYIWELPKLAVIRDLVRVKCEYTAENTHKHKRSLIYGMLKLIKDLRERENMCKWRDYS